MNSGNKIIISKVDGKRILIYLANDKPVDIRAYNSFDDIYIPGTIVNGRITKQISNGGCFLRYTAKGDTGYLDKTYKCETVLPVMYKKDAIGDKKETFTDKLSITGYYTIVFSDNFGIRASSRLSKRLKEKYTELLLPLCKDNDVSIMLRSSVTDVLCNDDVINECRNIIEKIQYISKQGARRNDYAVLYQPLPELISDCYALLGDEIDEIVTDDVDIYNELTSDYDAYFGIKKLSDRVHVRLYDDKQLPLAKLYSFEKHISGVLSRVVYLNNGANITFDQTEALMAVDVNSASAECKKNSSRDDFILNLNMEAANEVFKQLRLRNISGIIIIDFINMTCEESYKRLSEYISTLVKKDIVKSDFYGFTALGLAEVTRQKKKKSFYLQMR